MKKNNIIVILFFIFFCFQINVYADECSVFFSDTIIKKDETGNYLSGAGFSIYDYNKRYLMNYVEESPGRFSIQLSNSNYNCNNYPIFLDASINSKPILKRLSQTISPQDAGTEAELKYRATVATDVADLGSIQLRSVATSDEYPNEIDSGEVTIEVQKKSTAFVENATEVIRNPKTGSIISMILCVLSIGIVFTLNYRYQKKHLD